MKVEHLAQRVVNISFCPRFARSHISGAQYLITNADFLSYLTDIINWKLTLTKPLLLSEWYVIKWTLVWVNLAITPSKRKTFNDCLLVMFYVSKEVKYCFALLFPLENNLFSLKLMIFQSSNELCFLSFMWLVFMWIALKFSIFYCFMRLFLPHLITVTSPHLEKLFYNLSSLIKVFLEKWALLNNPTKYNDTLLTKNKERWGK